MNKKKRRNAATSSTPKFFQLPLQSEFEMFLKYAQNSINQNKPKL